MLSREWDSNPHGAGIAYIDKTKVANKKKTKKVLKIEKGLMSKLDLIEALTKQLGQTVLAHLRQATHGEVNKGNTHPFLTCKGGAAMAHNGILPSPFSSSEDVSDSAMMASTLNMLSFVDVVRDNLEIGNNIGWNKIALLSKDGYIHIINDQYGEWISKGSVWISQRLTNFARTYGSVVRRSHYSSNLWQHSKFDVGDEDLHSELEELNTDGWVTGEDGAWRKNSGWISQGRELLESNDSVRDNYTSKWLEAEAMKEKQDKDLK